MKTAQHIEIEVYTTDNGKAPFISWLEALKDKTVRYRIKERLDRVSLGNLGDYKNISKNLYELRFNFGAGCRVYFGRVEDRLIILLSGGSKSSQEKDIKMAKKYWEDYLCEADYD